MNEKTKFYYRVERRPRPESHRQRAAIAEEKNEDLRERIKAAEERIKVAEEEYKALLERNTELENREENRALRERERRTGAPTRGASLPKAPPEEEQPAQGVITKRDQKASSKSNPFLPEQTHRFAGQNSKCSARFSS